MMIMNLNTVFDDKMSTSMLLLKNCIFVRCWVWPWLLNPWLWVCHQCHVDLVISFRG